MRKLWNIVRLVMFGVVTAMALAACGGGGDGGSQPKTTALSGEVRVPSTTTAPTLEIRDLSGTVVTTIPLTPKSGTANTYTYSLPSLTIGSDYVLISTNGSMVLRTLIDKAALSSASTTKNVDTYTTTAIIVVEKALSTPTPPGTLGSKNATPAQTQAASASIATLPPATIENNLTTSLAACTSGTATQSQAQLASLVNIVTAAVSSNVDPAAFVANNGTVPAITTVTATTYTAPSGATAGAVTSTSGSITATTAATTATTVAATLPKISSAGSTTFTVGTAGSFTVIGTGTLSIAGTLPSGVTFNAATGVLSGTPAVGSNGTYTLAFTATSSGLTATQTFTLTVTPAATPPPTAPTGTTATAGNGQVTVSWTAVAGATSYNIYYAASTGVTKGTSTKVAGAVSPRAVTGLANGTTYFFAVTAVNANGESAESSQVSAAPAATSGAKFTQADLTGTWNFVKFTSGPGVVAGTGTDPGWMRGNVTINASGSVTVNSISSSSGAMTPPPAGAITQTIDANGVVTEGGDPVYASDPDNHAVMAANKMIAVGTSSGSSGNRSFRIFVKQVGIFSNADISSGTFAFNQLSTGANNGWQFGTGSINAAQQITLNTQLDSNGPTTLPPANFLTLAITAAGIVTNSGVNAAPTFQGVMTPDKKLIIGTETDPDNGSYKLRIIAIGGQTFTMADLQGTWSDHAITSATTPIWEYSTNLINSAGVLTTLSFKDSNGSTRVDGGGTILMDSTGILTVASEPSDHGVMVGKYFAVVTGTRDPGVFGMDILVK